MKENLEALAKLDLSTEARTLVDKLIGLNNRRMSIMVIIRDALSQLRMDMKYLAFDLEATRRERDEYKNKLGI